MLGAHFGKIKLLTVKLLIITTNHIIKLGTEDSISFILISKTDLLELLLND
jgi:hypothetical protein